MIKSVLVIVPHQDDELNIAGFIFKKLIDENIKIYILYVTKGNFYSKKYEKRMDERDKVLNIFGNIEYKQMNWDDSYIEDNHTYNIKEKRDKVQYDIMQYVMQVKSDMIICVDCDKHPDHRMVSILFDNCIREIISCSDYRPIVLKKFAYLGVWGGKFDYFDNKLKETIPYLAGGGENEAYNNALPYSWEDRIRFKANYEDYQLAFWKSIVYKAYKKYYTQCGFRFFFRASNADIVYWYRNINNLLYQANIIVSSGNKRYINDYSINRIEEINDKFEGIGRFSECAWVPSEDDVDKFFVAKWEKPIRVKTIKIYQNYRDFGHLNSFEIELSNGWKRIFYCSDLDTEKYDLGKQFEITWLKFKIISANGAAGIREFEAYTDDGEFPWKDVPLQRYVHVDDTYRHHINLYKCIYWFQWTMLRIKNRIRRYMGLITWD